MGKIIEENGKIWLLENQGGKHFKKIFIGVSKEEEKIEIIEKDDVIEIKPKKRKEKKGEDN